MSDLAARHCAACEGGIASLSQGQVPALLAQLDGWEIVEDGVAIARTFKFANYHETMAFVNAIVWVAHREGHHPDLSVHYNRCVVRYSTHAVEGLTENDFICAAKIDALLRS